MGGWWLVAGGLWVYRCGELLHACQRRPARGGLQETSWIWTGTYPPTNYSHPQPPTYTHLPISTCTHPPLPTHLHPPGYIHSNPQPLTAHPCPHTATHGLTHAICHPTIPNHLHLFTICVQHCMHIRLHMLPSLVEPQEPAAPCREGSSSHGRGCRSCCGAAPAATSTAAAPSACRSSSRVFDCRWWRWCWWWRRQASWRRREAEASRKRCQVPWRGLSMHLYFMIYVNHGASFDIHSKKVSTFSLRKFPFLLSDHTQCIHTCMCTLARTARPTWMAKAMASSGTSATSFHTGLSARSCMSKLPPDVFMKCMQLLGWCIRKGYTTASCILTPHIYVFVGSRRRCKEPPVTRAACNGKEARRSRYCAPERGGCGKKAYMFARMCKNKYCAPSLKSHRKTCMFVATVYIARHSWSMLLVGCFVKCVCEIFIIACTYALCNFMLRPCTTS